MSDREKNRQKWFELVELFQSGDLSQAKFCHEFDIAVPTFQYWRKQYRKKESSQNRVEFVEVVPDTIPALQFSIFKSELELRFPMSALTDESLAAFIKSLA